MRWLIPTLALFLCALALVAQTNQVDSEGLPLIDYEGQPVSDVELVTDPRVDIQPLQNLVGQKAGEPYSRQAIENTIKALKGTGRFTAVDVAVQPVATGLKVLFVMEPAFYYGVAEFPGVGRTFSYARLLQVVDLPDQTPYQNKEVDRARTDLLDFLRRNGYFQSQVESSAELDQAHGLANVTFHVTLGRRAKVGTVRVEGPPPQEAARLIQVTRSQWARFTGASLKPGKTYSPGRVRAATTLIRKRLVKQGHLASHIRIDPPQYHADTNRADVTIHVDEGPVIAVSITGASLSWFPPLREKEKHKLIPVYQEGAIDPDLVEEGKRNLISFFQAKGFFDVKVNTTFRQTPRRILLVYQVDREKKHKVEKIAFRGNQHFDEDVLEKHVILKKAHLFSHGKFSEQLLQKSVKDLKAFYVDHGYEEVSITPAVVDREPQLDITFQIAEGPETRVADVEFEGNQHFSPASLSPRKGLQLRPGEPFSPGQLNQDRGNVLAVYLDNGYLQADVKTVVERHTDDPHQVDIVYQINEGQQVRVNQVAIAGAVRTRPGFIGKTTDLQVEAPLSQGKLLQSENELYNLGIFDWASVGPRRPIISQTDEEAVVKVHEAPRNTIKYGFGLEVSRRGGSIPSGTVAVPGLPTIGLNGAVVAPSEATFISPRGNIQYSRRNMRGLGETGSISLLLSRLDQRFLATYAQPHFSGTRWSSLYSISAERTTENPLFAARLENGTFQLERPLNKDKTTTTQIRYSFQKTDLSQLLAPQLVLPEDRNVRLSTFSGSIIRDTRDKPLDAHRGIFETIDLGITAKAIGASANFARLLAQTAYYQEIGHGIVWANSIRLGLAKALGNSHVPTSERFFSGGGTTLRGFPIDGAGPQRIVPFCGVPGNPSTCANITVPVGGDQLFVLNTELRFPLGLMKNLGGVVFYDGGNVYSNINFARFYQDYTNTVGFGFRYSTPVGPIRVDIGRNLNPVPGFRATQFFVTLGQAF